MTEQPHDSSDDDTSIDGEMVVALTEVDVIIEKHIRGAIGDYAYEAYLERIRLHDELNDSMGDEVRAGFGRPIDHAEEQARILMKKMIEEGKGEEEAKREAVDAAFRALFAEKSTSEDRDFMQAYTDITDTLELSIQESLLLTQKYPDIEVLSADEGQLSLAIAHHIEGDGEDVRKVTLQVIFSVDGSTVTTSVFYVIAPRDLFGKRRRKPERIEIDPAEYDNVTGDVDLEVLKQDALQALQAAIRGVS